VLGRSTVHWLVIEFAIRASQAANRNIREGSSSKANALKSESTLYVTRPSFFPYFSYSTRSLYTAVHLSVRIFFSLSPFSGSLIAQFHSTFFPFLFFDSSQIENEPE
jgi:hypothetical protein